MKNAIWMYSIYVHNERDIRGRHCFGHLHWLSSVRREDEQLRRSHMASKAREIVQSLLNNDDYIDTIAKACSNNVAPVPNASERVDDEVCFIFNRGMRRRVPNDPSPEHSAISANTAKNSCFRPNASSMQSPHHMQQRRIIWAVFPEWTPDDRRGTYSTDIIMKTFQLSLMFQTSPVYRLCFHAHRVPVMWFISILFVAMWCLHVIRNRWLELRLG